MTTSKPTTNLAVQHQPQVTRYNRVALWGGIGAVVLIMLTYSLVIRDHGRHVVEARNEQLTTLPQPLIPKLPKAPPAPPPPPVPSPKEQPVTWHPVAPTAPQTSRQENPLVTKRRKEREDAYRSPMLVAAFSPDKRQQAQETRPAMPAAVHYPQTLEIEPTVTRDPAPWDVRGRQAPVLQTHGFGDFSERTPQYLNATLQPPQSPYQINAGMLIPVVLAQDVTSDVPSFFSAIVTHDVYDAVTSRFLLVPAGSRITFLTDVDERTNQQPMLLMAAKTLYLPNGLMRWNMLYKPAIMVSCLIASWAVFFAFLAIAIQMGLTLMESYIVIGGGIILLGFGGFRGTVSIAEKFLSYMIGVGVKLFVISLLVGARSQLVMTWLALAQDARFLDIVSTPMSSLGVRCSLVLLSG